MVESGVDVISDPTFVRGAVAGLIVLTLGIVFWAVRGRDDVLGFGGLMVAAATVLVLYQSGMLGLSQLAGVTLLAIAGLFHRSVVVGTLIALYSEGAQAKTKALADSLGQRLTDIVRFNLNIEEIHGLEKTFVEYRLLNPDISAAGLTVNGQILIHTNSSLVGKRWVSDSSTYEYVVELTSPRSVREIRIAVAMPIATVYNRTLRSVKNFTALFVASAFLAGLFLQLAASMQRSRTLDETSAGTLRTSVDDEVALSLVKPVFFVGVFLEFLNYAFLPQFVDRVVAASGLSAGYVSAPFIAYYLCFALALVPSGHFAQHATPRPLMYVGLFLAGAGLMTLALRPDFIMVMVARSISGIGQGMLFIGVQSYILTMALPSKKTQGAAIIVFGFQGGMISGMAIGSLLVAYLGAKGVFIVAAITAFAMALYAIGVVPVAIGSGRSGQSRGMSLGHLGRSMAQALRNLEFLKAMFLIGVPAKAVLTGIIIFALPLLLARKQYAAEDIGQIIMVYAAGVVLANVYVSRLVDRIGHTRTILFWGSAISGFGLVLIGLIEWAPLGAGPHGSTLVTAVLIAGVATVGVAHGFINAPVITHVAESSFAMKVGASSATATYRFLERIGHVAGPIIVGQMFLVFGQNALSLTWTGGAIALLGLLFLLRFARPRAKLTMQEIPS